MKKRLLPQGLASALVLFCCLGLVPKVSAKPVDWIVAVVNDDIILNSELEERVKAIAQMSGQSLASVAAAQMDLLKSEVLRQMIREKLTAQEVARLKISVSEREVEGTLERIKEANGLDDAQLAEMLRREGRTLEQLKAKIREDMERARLIERVLKSKTVITEDQVDAYLRDQRNDPEEKRRLAVIFLPAGADATQRATARQKAEEILAKIRDGADFAGLARAYSQGPGADQGGDIGYIKAKDLAGPLERVTRELEVGGVSQVVESSAGFYIVKLLDVQRADLKNVDERLREKARQELFQQEVNKKYEKWIRELEAKSFIQVHLAPPSEGS
ncbi:MAG: peptidylprolyl isomerase [Desulfacinum sp.]|nr:peptidylprolyl isomerase [Desulfacinum sp.]